MQELRCSSIIWQNHRLSVLQRWSYLKVRCQPEIQGGFDKIVAFKKKMHAKAKLKSPDGRNDYADRFAAALWFSQNSSALAEVFDQDGDHRLTKEEMAIVRPFFFRSITSIFTNQFTGSERVRMFQSSL